MITNAIKEAIKLCKREEHHHQKAFIGFDGYIDYIQRMVHTQESTGKTYFDTISNLASHVQSLAGRSGQIAWETQETKIGGNAPILAHSLARLGISNWCAGSFGLNRKYPVFDNIHPEVTRLSISDPATSHALEFDDGKIILSDIEPFEALDWKLVERRIGKSTLTNTLSKSNLIFLVDWCNVPKASDIWTGLLNNYLSHLHHRPAVFFDLADPSKKSSKEVEKALEIMTAYRQHGTVILGVNENEARQLGTRFLDKPAPDVQELGQELYNFLDLDILLVHPVASCHVFSKENSLHFKNRVIQRPRISTGGGDNLNAGFGYGLLQGASMPACAVLGMATAGAYVRSGNSPDLNELATYLTEWQHELL